MRRISFWQHWITFFYSEARSMIFFHELSTLRKSLDSMGICFMMSPVVKTETIFCQSVWTLIHFYMVSPTSESIAIFCWTSDLNGVTQRMACICMSCMTCSSRVSWISETEPPMVHGYSNVE